MRVRVNINLSGLVQGINMRAMIKMTAISLNLTGYVRNLRDNTVQIMAEGEKDDLEELIRWLNEHRGPDRIDKIEDFWSGAKNEFGDFSIKY